ncbi:citrus tristeza virus P13 protein [Drosophila suzukii associated hytrosavirus 1]|nr:citrus tristeza virus P13 protein [Drosophila suzukii associated hytrosavirus 1]
MSLETINIKYTIQTMEKEDIAYFHSTLNLIGKFVDDLMEGMFEFNKEEYTWCIAGGFAAYISNVTDKYNDVDVFILTNKKIPTLLCKNIETDHYTFDIILKSIDGDLTNFEKKCYLLAQFDLDIARRAIINKNDILVVQLENPKNFYELNQYALERMHVRRRKYYKRLNREYVNRIPSKWSRISIPAPDDNFFGKNFYDDFNNDLHFKYLCKEIMYRYFNKP